LFAHGFTRALFTRQQRRDCFRDPRHVTPALIDRAWERLQRAGGQAAAYATVRALVGMPASTSDPGRVRAPTLIVWGDEDRALPLAHGRRLARAIAGTRLEVVPACGHVPFVERPDQFLRLVMPFLADTTARHLPVAPVPPGRSLLTRNEVHP
jgi:pimeloyl-ACP methyl ester carboxylesterase